jgi:peptidylprolyl isomerase
MSSVIIPRFAAMIGVAIGALMLESPVSAGGDERPGPGKIVATAPDADWRAIPLENLLVFELDGGQRFVMELARDFAPAHIANIRALVRAHWYDGTAITRVQDNYVIQWSGPASGKALPRGIAAQPPQEYDCDAKGVAFRPLGHRDAYAAATGFVAGWPAAREGGRVWLTHCYGMVGVGRDMPPDTGSGAELYAVIGHAPRHLDRNLAVVGRVVQGMALLAALPRGDDAMGNYPPAKYVRIARARLASEIPAAERPRIEILDSASPSFARWLAARANRPEAFFVRPARAVDICNAQAPIRERGP